jgi:putative SOS response-associated peptidase YedK
VLNGGPGFSEVVIRGPFAIALKSGEPYAFAGLWESWQPKDGSPLETFTILTTAPNEIMAPIHNRMPVIVAMNSGLIQGIRLSRP